MKMRRPLVILLVLGIGLASWDFFARIFVGRDAALRDFQQVATEALPQRPDSQTVRERLVAWMPQLAGSAGIAAPLSDPTGWQLSLVGVFQQDQGRFALVYAQPRGAGEAELLRVAEGDEIHGSRVDTIGPKQVRLEAGEDSRELILFERGETPVVPRGSPAGVAPVGVTSRRSSDPGSNRERIAETRAKLRTRQTTAESRRNAALEARSARQPSPTMSPSVPNPPDSAGGNSSSDRKVVEPKKLNPGEEFKNPFDLPVVEDEASPKDKGP